MDADERAPASVRARAAAVAIDPRDVARIRTEARLVELALVGLVAEVRATMPADRPIGANEVGLAIATAREFAERCQVALSMAMMRLPGSNEYKPGGSH